MRRTLALAAIAAAGLGTAGCGSTGAATRSRHPAAPSQHKVTTAGALPARPKPPQPTYPRLLAGATSSLPSGFVPAVTVRGQTAVSVARSQSGIAMLSFSQRLLELRLHSGTVDAGTAGWRWGPVPGASEQRHLAAAFNGGFKLAVGAGGFMSYGRVGAALTDGLGSVVTYADGHTDIGSWHQEVPAPGRAVVSVRQNLMLLVDNGNPASNADCLSCWGATLGGVSDPARSALGITADAHLIFAGAEHLTAADLANALIGAGAVRAVELDINPAWVAAYLYGHRGGKGPLAAVPIVPGQPGVAGQFLAPYTRDFFTIVAK